MQSVISGIVGETVGTHLQITSPFVSPIESTKVYVEYFVNLTTGAEPSEIIGMLQFSIDSGDYLSQVEYLTGVTIQNITSSAIVDLSPPAEPVSPPTTVSAEGEN